MIRGSRFEAEESSHQSRCMSACPVTVVVNREIVEIYRAGAVYIRRACGRPTISQRNYRDCLSKLPWRRRRRCFVGNLVQAVSNNRCRESNAVYVVGANKDSHIRNVSART